MAQKMLFKSTFKDCRAPCVIRINNGEQRNMLECFMWSANIGNSLLNLYIRNQASCSF